MTKIPSFWIDNISIDKQKRFKCVGCGNCTLLCNKNAIELRYDSECFLYPKIDESKCVNCGLCGMACPIINVKDVDNPVQMVIGGYTREESVLMNSTSGGFAYELSKAIIQDNGIVYGVSYNTTYSKAVYIEAKTMDDLKKITGTKYIQNEKNSIFIDVKEKLEKNSLVLFIGCPCDVAALKNYLEKDYTKLYTCEIACMGATSNAVLDSFISEQENRSKSKISYINMRSKKYGWYVASLHVKYENGKEAFLPFYGTGLGYGFLNYSRPSCYECRFRGKNTSADFKTGDFWGVKPRSKSWNSNGSSCTIIGTSKAKVFFENKMMKTYEYEVLDSKILDNNPSFYSNKDEKQISKRDLFVNDFIHYGLQNACKKNASLGFWAKKYIPIYIQIQLKKLIHRFLDR